MALVAYDYGSDSEEGESEEELENNENTAANLKTSIVNGSTIISGNNDASPTEKPSEFTDDHTCNRSISSEISDEEDMVVVSNSNITSNLFENLPKTKIPSQDDIKTDFDDVVEDFIPKAEVENKQKGKVKITIPSLSEFNDEDDEPAPKKYKQSVKGSGLLSLLPPVKCIPLSNKSFIPNVLTQKKKNMEPVKKPSKPLIPNSVRKKKEEVQNKFKETESDDSDIEMPESYDEELWQKVCGKKVVKDIIVEQPKVEEPTINLAPEPVAPYEGLDNAAFKELVGKNKRMPRNIKLIDVNEDELVAEKDLWMTKSLTDPEYKPKPSEDDDESLDPTKKKKHHITYLAQKAKANEQELQSQWATSKHNRMQSRAKYGF